MKKRRDNSDFRRLEIARCLSMAAAAILSPGKRHDIAGALFWTALALLRIAQFDEDESGLDDVIKMLQEAGAK